MPSERFPLFEEAQRKVNRDGHVEVKRSYYSVPPEYLGRTVWARWDARLVRIFNEKMTQIAIHVRHEPGRFSTQSKHLAPEKINSIERGVHWLLGKVALIGPQSIAWAQAMLCARGIEGTRVLQGLIALTKRHSSEALENACKTALLSGEFRLQTIRKLAARPSQMVQAELPFLDEHPLIRPLDDYARVVADACVLFEDYLEQEWLAGRVALALQPGPVTVLLHGHCHQKAMGLVRSARALLSRIPGCTVEDLDAGCCGMAGSFGYAREHYEVSRQIGERRLLPAVRSMQAGTVLAAAGVSCRQQVEHFTGVAAVHPAQLLRSLIRSG